MVKGASSVTSVPDVQNALDPDVIQIVESLPPYPLLNPTPWPPYLGRFEFSKGQVLLHGTGTVIGPRHVFTAAHNLFGDPQEGEAPWYTLWEHGYEGAFTLGRYGASHGTTLGVSALVLEAEYVDAIDAQVQPHRSHERAIVVLEDNEETALHTPWMQISGHPDRDWYEDRWMYLLGYPGSAPGGFPNHPHFSFGSLKEFHEGDENLEVRYGNSSGQGFSGGPVCILPRGEPFTGCFHFVHTGHPDWSLGLRFIEEYAAAALDAMCATPSEFVEISCP